MSILIREAKESDIESILSFIQELADYEKLSHQVIATTESLKLHIFGHHKYANVIIGEYESKVVGFALYFYNYSTFLAKPGIYLEDLYVQPEYRGKGIGKQLLLTLFKFANENNFGRVEWSVLNWNTPAQEFYTSVGAKPMDEWTVWRKEI